MHWQYCTKSSARWRPATPPRNGASRSCQPSVDTLCVAFHGLQVPSCTAKSEAVRSAWGMLQANHPHVSLSSKTRAAWGEFLWFQSLCACGGRLRILLRNRNYQNYLFEASFRPSCILHSWPSLLEWGECVSLDRLSLWMLCEVVQRTCMLSRPMLPS